IGLNLIQHLKRTGARLRALASERAQRALAGSPLLDGTEVGVADLRDLDAMERAVQGAGVIFNLAGRSGATASNADPVGDADVNVKGQLVLLEACRRSAPQARVVFASSRLVYEPSTLLPICETASTE